MGSTRLKEHEGKEVISVQVCIDKKLYMKYKNLVKTKDGLSIIHETEKILTKAIQKRIDKY